MSPPGFWGAPGKKGPPPPSKKKNPSFPFFFPQRLGEKYKLLGGFFSQKGGQLSPGDPKNGGQKLEIPLFK